MSVMTPAMSPLTGTQFQIAAGDYSAVATELGAGLRELRHRGRPLIVGFEADELPPGAAGQLLLPWPNRIDGGRYQVAGTGHQLDLSEPAAGNAIHGLTRWSAWSPARQDPDAVALRLDLLGRGGYPFRLDLAVEYRLDPAPPLEDSVPVGTTARAGLPSFLSYVQRTGAWDALATHVRLPVQERRTGFTHLQKSQALVTALAAGCRRARDSDFVLSPDPLAGALLGLPRWPHSSALTRHLRAFRPQHVAALRAAGEAVLAQHSQVRWRLRRTARATPGQWSVIDCDQTAISANGRT